MYIYIFEIGKKQREYAFVLTSLFRDYSLIRGFYIYIYIFTYIYIYINKATAERIKKKSPLTICCLFSSIHLKTDATTLFRMYCHLGKILQATSNRKSTQNI